MTIKTINCPDIGVDSAEVIEILVEKGESVEKDQAIITLESDKASMDIPIDFSGVIEDIIIKVGDSVKHNDPLLKLKESASSDDSTDENSIVEEKKVEPKNESKTKEVEKDTSEKNEISNEKSDGIYAGPAVRKLARKLGVLLNDIANPTGEKGRISQEDLYKHIKNKMNSGGGVSYVELPNFSDFGEVEIKSMSRLHQLTANHMQNINSSIPQVTQFDQVDITDLEKFRKELFATSKGAVKLSVLPFIIKSCAYALRKYPQVNSAVDMPNNSIVYKKYINIGVAVDTEAGLVVPVVKSVLDKTIVEIAQEVSELASLAHKGALKPNQMQGGCFTVSSLGGIGGTFFTPIVNAPEVAILGVGKATKQPQFDLNGDLFEGLSMPLSLSYDHRAINGGDGARFITHIKNLLADIRSMSLE